MAASLRARLSRSWYDQYKQTHTTLTLPKVEHLACNPDAKDKAPAILTSYLAVASPQELLRRILHLLHVYSQRRADASAHAFLELLRTWARLNPHGEWNADLLESVVADINSPSLHAALKFITYVQPDCENDRRESLGAGNFAAQSLLAVKPAVIAHQLARIGMLRCDIRSFASFF